MSDLEWRPVVGFEGFYEVNERGDVRGVPRVVGAANGKTKMLRYRARMPYAVISGHLYVDLYRGRQRTKVAVHRAVLQAFVGPAPEGTEACHRNGNPTDNHVSNLYWGSRSENNHDKVRHGTDHNVSKTHCPQGHPYSGHNLYIRPRGGRICRECSRRSKAAYKMRKKAIA